DEYNDWTFFLGSGGANWGILRGPPIDLNTWTHVAATYDGTTARLYIDGQLAASAPLSYSPNTVSPLRIAAGNTEGNPDFFVPGRVDEAAVYPSVLSASRIKAHYDAAKGSSTTETVLINDWCQQFTSGAPDDLTFGPDGALYMQAGQG